MSVRTLQWAGRIRRAMLPLAIVLGVLLWWNYGTLTVPRGMDSMPDYPPGTLCIIAKEPGNLAVGQVVFVDLGGGTVLTRITALDEETVTVRHDADDSALPDSDEVGPLPRSAVRALLLTAFRSDG